MWIFLLWGCGGLDLVGLWDLARWEQEGQVVEDAGWFEFVDDGSGHLVLRYRFEDGAFTPAPTPEVWAFAWDPSQVEDGELNLGLGESLWFDVVEDGPDVLLEGPDLTWRLQR